MRTDIGELLARIEGARDDLSDLALRLGNTFGPVGQEAATAAEVHAWYLENGIESQLQPIIPGRANVIARLPGSGTGRTLLFNAHLDTEASGADYDNLMQVADINRLGARREGERLFGHTVLNDRGCMAVFMIAGRALRQSAIRLEGDVLLSSVVGETGQSPVDEYQGLQYEGKGFGSTHMLQQGLRADFALVAETTNNAIGWYNCGAIYFKVTLRGRNMYTPRLIRTESLADHPNAIVKAATAIQAIESWAIDRERTMTRQTRCGVVRPKAQVGAFRGGIPWRPNRSSPYAALYVDVRTLPGEDPAEVTASLSTALDGAGVGAELTATMIKAGHEGRNVEPLIDAISAAHQLVRGGPPPAEAESAVLSMWRDTNVFNPAGIPAVTFGPSRGRADIQGEGHFELDDLVAAAKMYALTALQISAGLKPSELTD